MLTIRTLQVTGQSLPLHTSDQRRINLSNVNQNTNINSRNHAMPFENKCLVQTLQSHWEDYL